MLAHGQGGLLNAAKLASGLGVSAPTVVSYVDLLAGLLLVRRLPPRHANVKKRLVKSPRVYVRDSGLVHALLRVADLNALLGHPVVGPSWEGFVIETLPGCRAVGRVALVLPDREWRRGPTWCLTCPDNSAPGPSRSSGPPTRVYPRASPSPAAT